MQFLAAAAGPSHAGRVPASPAMKYLDFFIGNESSAMMKYRVIETRSIVSLG
jgi:hypothetical protein